ncbi:hypothetical protein DV515_00015174 [Chloebia gouldiae]|uniref:Uncharacterized protein n=1 Tax=Chloebia gouldiae TaxID=44316 RepID=A0A3L8RX91_CHLGU|nr:hypothetical protein DV515_00015174 [Chloebia gouldiae]
MSPSDLTCPALRCASPQHVCTAMEVRSPSDLTSPQVRVPSACPYSHVSIRPRVPSVLTCHQLLHLPLSQSLPPLTATWPSASLAPLSWL